MKLKRILRGDGGTSMHSKLLRVAMTAILAIILALPLGTVALADEVSDLQAQLDAASATLDELGEQVMSAGEELNETQVQLQETADAIADTETQIEAKQAELEENQDKLADIVSDEYKTGPLSLLALVLNSTSVEEFVSNVYYLNKLNEQSVATIDAVNTARAELDAKKTELEGLQAEQQALVDQKQAQVAELESEQAQQQAYVDSLSEEVKRALEEKRQRELEEQRRRAEEAQRQQQQQQQQQEQQQQQSQPSQPSTPSTPSAPSVPSSGGGGLSSSARQTIVNAAYTQLGVPYSYGACSPGVAFDCSGFTSWCYAQAGISIPHSAASQGYTLTPVSSSNLQPGDLLVWLGGMNPMSGNHVALYAGDGMMIHANWGGVEVIPVNSWSRSYDVCGYIN